MHILVVEDDAPLAKIVKKSLESGGHTVPQEAYRFPRILGKTFPSDAVLETSWRFVRGEPEDRAQ